MTGFVLRFVVNTVALYVVSRFVPGVTFDSITALVIASLALGVLNAIVRPILFWLTLPLTIVTLGLFLIVLNGIILGLAAWLVNGFDIAGVGPALIAGIALGLISLITNRIGRKDS